MITPIPLRIERYLDAFFREYYDRDLECLCRKNLSKIQQISGRNPKALVAALIYYCGKQLWPVSLPQSRAARIFHISESTLRMTVLYLKKHRILEVA